MKTSDTAPATTEGPQIAITGEVRLPPPEGANFFHFTVLGGEVQMLIGSINILRVIEAKKEGASFVVPEISHRFLLSSVGFAHLRTQFMEIAKLYDVVNLPASPTGQ